jgi:hypothetical protein
MGKVAWWVPRWSYARRLVLGHRDILRSLSCPRILTGSLVGSAVICGGLKAKFPDLELYELWKMPLAVVGLFVAMGFNLILLPILIPPRFTVTGEEIRYSHGQSGWVAKRGECTSFKLVVFSPGLRRLVFRYKGKRHSVGLTESVDVDELCSLLPRPVKWVEGGRRFAFFHGDGSATRGNRAL